MEIVHKHIATGSVGNGLDSQLTHLLAGLERQKEELGPIADELIELLRRYGVRVPAGEREPVNPSGG